MTRMLCTLASGLALALTAAAQSPSLPQAYGFQATVNMFGPAEIKVNRNVSKELIEVTGASYHIRVLYDFQAHKIYTTDLSTNSCTMQEYRSSYAPTMHDPIGGLEEIRKQGGMPPTTRNETVNGIATKMAENNEGQKIWIEAQYGYGFPVKIEAGGQPMFEMRKLVYGLSAPNLFAVPPGCTAAGGYSDANGGHYVSGTGEGAPATDGANRGGGTGGNASVKADGKTLLGEWTFTGKDGKGVVWNGTLKIDPLGEYSSDAGKYSNMCDVNAQSANAGKGFSSGCMYNALDKTLTWSSEGFSLSAVLSPDGRSLTQGKWVEKGAAGSWSAKR
jgi:hypothetical protein